MIFVCPLCKKEIHRDLRSWINRQQLTKAGNYKTFCDKHSQTVYAKPKTLCNSQKNKSKKS